jgi:hypothetical protein
MVLALFGAGVGAATYAEEIAVPPVLEVTRPDGTQSRERSGFWRYQVPALDVEPAAEAGSARRQIIFLLDVSASMPQVHGRKGSFSEVVAEVVRRAGDLLRPYEHSSAFEVSFYRFGDLRQRSDGTWVPHVTPVEGAIDVSVAQALPILQTFVPTNPAEYDERYTYVAASVHEALRRELGLSEDPRAGIPPDSPPVAVFAFTDAGEVGLGGGESHARGRTFASAPYRAWLDQHSRSLQVEYHYWNLAELDSAVLQPPASATYLVSWGQGGRVDSVNVRGDVVGLTRSLEVAPLLRLTPALSLPDLAQRTVCRAAAAESAHGPAGTVVDLSLIGPATFKLGDLSTYAAGQHAVLLDSDVLCAELTRVYPNSTFVLPGSQDRIEQLGFVDVVEYPHYAFSLRGEGIAADHPLEPLTADRFHVYSTSERGLVVDAPAHDGLEAMVRWSLEVEHLDSSNGPQAVDPAAGLATLAHNADRGQILTTRAGELVDLKLPGFEQSWVPIVGKRVESGHGKYQALVCARVDLVTTPDPVYTSALECPKCRISSEGRSGSNERCVTVAFELAERPAWWGTVAAATLAVLAALWALVRYLSHPAPAHGLVVRLRTPRGWQTSELRCPPVSLTGIAKRFRGTPAFLSIYANGVLRFSFEDPRLAREPGSEANETTSLGQAPLAILRVRGSALRPIFAKLEPAASTVGVSVGVTVLATSERVAADASALIARRERTPFRVGELEGELVAPGAPPPSVQ